MTSINPSQKGNKASPYNVPTTRAPLENNLGMMLLFRKDKLGLMTSTNPSQRGEEKHHPGRSPRAHSIQRHIMEPTATVHFSSLRTQQNERITKPSRTQTMRTLQGNNLGMMLFRSHDKLDLMTSINPSQEEKEKHHPNVLLAPMIKCSCTRRSRRRTFRSVPLALTTSERTNTENNAHAVRKQSRANAPAP